MNGIIKQIEKGKPIFEKISRNIYLGAIRDGFLSAMPVILFASLFILVAAVPEVFGFAWPEHVSNWLWKVYNYSMGVVGLIVSATTARCLSESVNRRMPEGKVINSTSVMLASIVGFLLLSVTPIDGGFSTDYLGSKGLLAAFVSAFITVNVYKFCVLKNITIKMPKEVPGTISQTFKDIFPFAFSVLAMVIIDLIVRNTLDVSFAEALTTLLSPLFTAADGYLGICIIWGMMALFWFVGVHGPSIVEPAIAAIIYANVEANLKLFNAGEQTSNVLTVGLGNFVGTMGGTGATLVVPFIFLLMAKSKQLKAVGKASFVPVSFAVNEPLLFSAPIILNPYFFIPFLLTPMVNVCLFKFFVDVIGMNSFMYVLPWATPAPIGLVLGTGMSLWAFILVALLIIVDFLIYLPFCRAYDNVLFAKEKAEVQTEAYTFVQPAVVGATALGGGGTHVQENTQISEAAPTLEQQTRVLVLCAGAGTSAMLANALTEGAEDYNVPITASAGAYGSHYDIMENFDMIILAPQVGSYYDDIKEDADRLNVKLIATKGVEYINLTRDAKKAIDFVLEHHQ
ncbi:PTS lactose transporter subunit IIBC [Priestia endophytica]|jgi:lactose PTS system EIICB component|uniref:PTS system lactose-specific EIICB component n=1 Tax=Priestia endophytica DSM 13796 TaxID=1121089 RepID=A0A1I5ZFY2_9BACI|nr:PTS lactose transporter subunit IIBC [Priestia endophytica]KYG29850.1 PTS lactose transporter subunit IIBC [Priestia endophytica]MBG9812612.1 PTS system lactose-specific transporter subunits IICB [Priestia endophytica]SFQ55341.1 PTS system, lactose-specific IIC component [Priestia endophytica DSM 13796]